MHKKTKHDTREKQTTAVNGSNSRHTRGSSVTVSAGKTAGKQDKKQEKKQAGKRVRKPLTDEQRKRKNMKARISRMIKRMGSEAAKTMSDEDRRRLEAMNRLESREHQRQGCVHCSPACRNYEKCRGYARTEGLPKLHKVQIPPSCSPRTPVSLPPPEPRGSVFGEIAAWVREKLDMFKASPRCHTAVSGSSFNCPDGILKVELSISRPSLVAAGPDSGAAGACLATARNRRPQEAAWRSEVAPALVTPPPVLGPGWLCGIDWGLPGGPEAYGDLCAIERIVRSSGWDESYCS